MVEAIGQERRFAEFTPLRDGVLPRLSLEQALGEGAPEIREILRNSRQITLRHDEEAKEIAANDPDYVPGVNVSAHNDTVGEIAYQLGKVIGLDDDRCLRLLVAGKLHDVGKSEQKLHLKKGLTAEDRDHIHDHQLISGRTILRNIQALRYPENISFMYDVYDLVVKHHDPVTLDDLILNVADMYGAMRQHRDRAALTSHLALARICHALRVNCKYIHFHGTGKIGLVSHGIRILSRRIDPLG